MKFRNLRGVFLLVFIALFSYTNAYAQYDDEFEDEQQQQEEVKCLPQNLLTGWDSLATKPLDQDIRLLYNFGYEYYKNKSYQEAMPYLWKVFLHDKGRYAKASIRKIAEIYFSRGQVDSTLIACYRGLKLFPDMMRLHHYAGLLQYKLGRYHCALPHFEQLVAKDSTNLNYLETLAFLYFKNNDERAIVYQQKVVDLNPTNAEAANTLATYVSSLRGEGADLEYRKKAWQKEPDNPELAYKYAETAVQSGEYKAALEPLAKVISKKPAPKVYKLRAEVYENLNKFAKAISDYKEILKTEKNNVNIMLRIAVNYRNMNSFSKARYWINKALRAKPKYGLAYITLGETYEAAVSYCQEKRGGKSKYEDKLVYLKAYKIYKLAEQDPVYRAKAKRKRENVKPFIPTQEDKFMHRNAKIKSACYDWLK